MQVMINQISHNIFLDDQHIETTFYITNMGSIFIRNLVFVVVPMLLASYLIISTSDSAKSLIKQLSNYKEKRILCNLYAGEWVLINPTRFSTR